MKVSLMRKEIKKMYRNPTWSKKVDKMHDNQVMAVYFNSWKNPGLYGTSKKPEENTGTQLTFDDILKNKGEII